MSILRSKPRALRWMVMAATSALTLTLAACGGSVPSPFTTGSPFSSSSDFDRTFIGAAQTWDLDKNSVVTCDEWKQYTTTSLRESDGDGDGQLNGDEFAVMARSDRLFTIADLSYYDANKDGKVSADEFSNKPNRAFQLLDRNADCKLDRTESAQVIQVDKKKDESVAPSADDLRRASR